MKRKGQSGMMINTSVRLILVVVVIVVIVGTIILMWYFGVFQWLNNLPGFKTENGGTPSRNQIYGQIIDGYLIYNNLGECKIDCDGVNNCNHCRENLCQVIGSYRLYPSNEKRLWYFNGKEFVDKDSEVANDDAIWKRVIFNSLVIIKETDEITSKEGEKGLENLKDTTFSGDVGDFFSWKKKYNEEGYIEFRGIRFTNNILETFPIKYYFKKQDQQRQIKIENTNSNVNYDDADYLLIYFSKGNNYYGLKDGSLFWKEGGGKWGEPVSYASEDAVKKRMIKEDLLKYCWQ